MRHRQSGRHLGRDTAHRKALYRNLVTDLLRFERITTTEAKAREIRGMAEKVVTLGKRGDLHARRQALKFVYDKRVVAHVFDNIAPRMADRAGGYLRITKLEPRKGDGAKMATIEFVDYYDFQDDLDTAQTTETAAAPAAPLTLSGTPASDTAGDTTAAAEPPAEAQATDDSDVEATVDAESESEASNEDSEDNEEAEISDADTTDAEPTPAEEEGDNDE